MPNLTKEVVLVFEMETCDSKSQKLLIKKYSELNVEDKNAIRN